MYVGSKAAPGLMSLAILSPKAAKQKKGRGQHNVSMVNNFKRSASGAYYWTDNAKFPKHTEENADCRSVENCSFSAAFDRHTADKSKKQAEKLQISHL